MSPHDGVGSAARARGSSGRPRRGSPAELRREQELGRQRVRHDVPEDHALALAPGLRGLHVGESFTESARTYTRAAAE